MVGDAMRYVQPPELSTEAKNKLCAIRTLENGDKKATEYRLFTRDFNREIKAREHVMLENISNFAYIANKKTKTPEERVILNEYGKSPGFYVKEEGDGDWLPAYLRTGKPNTIHYRIDHHEALALMDYPFTTEEKSDGRIQDEQLIRSRIPIGVGIRDGRDGGGNREEEVREVHGERSGEGELGLL